MQFFRSCFLVLTIGVGLGFAATPQLRQLAMVYIPGNPGFQSVAFYKGNLVISHSAAGTVDVFSSPKRRILAQIKLERPSGLVVDENDGVVYVADADAKNIAVISARNWKLQKTIPVKVQPGPLALSPDGEKLFVGNDYDGSISVVNVASGQVSTQGDATTVAVAAEALLSVLLSGVLLGGFGGSAGGVVEILEIFAVLEISAPVELLGSTR